MNKMAIACLEFLHIAVGISALDQILKGVHVKLLRASIFSPGRYVILIGGNHSEVLSAVEIARYLYGAHLYDTYILGNPHDQLLEVLEGKRIPNPIVALGIIEVGAITAAIFAADMAIKSAIIELIEIKISQELHGKGIVLLTGEVGAVSAALEIAKSQISQETLIYTVCIPRPSVELLQTLLQ